MVEKITTFYSFTIEQLNNLGQDEILKLLPSRARRSIVRGYTEQEKKLVEKIKNFKQNNINKKIKTHCREMVILPFMVGSTIHVHTGKVFQPVTITLTMIGKRLGDFALTRTRVRHSAPGVGATKSSMFVPIK